MKYCTVYCSVNYFFLFFFMTVIFRGNCQTECSHLSIEPLKTTPKSCETAPLNIRRAFWRDWTYFPFQKNRIKENVQNFETLSLESLEWAKVESWSVTNLGYTVYVYHSWRISTTLHMSWGLKKIQIFLFYQFTTIYGQIVVRKPVRPSVTNLNYFMFRWIMDIIGDYFTRWRFLNWCS